MNAGVSKRVKECSAQFPQYETIRPNLYRTCESVSESKSRDMNEEKGSSTEYQILTVTASNDGATRHGGTSRQINCNRLHYFRRPIVVQTSEPISQHMQANLASSQWPLDTDTDSHSMRRPKGHVQHERRIWHYFSQPQ